MNKKGVVLAITMVVLAILLVLTVAYFSSLIQENKVMSIQKAGAQSLLLAEAGANHALSELKHRIRGDLSTNVSFERQGVRFAPYVDINNPLPLEFLRDFAFIAPENQFTVANNKATLSVTDAVLPDNHRLEDYIGFQGGYSATITVEADGAPTNPQTDVFLFPYKFSIVSQGLLPNGTITPQIARNIRLRSGAFTIRVRRQPFSRFALFTELQRTPPSPQHPTGENVWFTGNTNFTGPVSTNGSFNFANNPSGTFTEEVIQNGAKAQFYNNGSPVWLDADSNISRFGVPIDKPIFSNPDLDKRFKRGQEITTLDTSLSKTDVKNEALGGGAAPTSNGVYVPNSGGCVTGGIYIRGTTGTSAAAIADDSTITMSTVGNNPVYTIIRGSAAGNITTTITENRTDPLNPRTVINQTGGGLPVINQDYCGTPDGIHNEGTIIYSNDTVKSFSGTVQSDSRVTVTSEKDIVITNNVLYQSHNDATPTTPINAEGFTNNLGIISWDGNVRIGTTAPNNIEIHGIVMATNGIFTVDNYASGSPRGTATLLGGAITDYYGAFGTFNGINPVSGYGRNFVYDVRMLNGTAPPYFPFMPFFMSGEDPPRDLDDKLDWQDSDQRQD